MTGSCLWGAVIFYCKCCVSLIGDCPLVVSVKKFFFGDQANKEKTFYQLTKEKLLGTGNGDDGVFGKWLNPIQLKKNGFYTLIEFKGEGTVVAGLETAFKRDERVIRYLTTKLDKHGVEYAVKRRAKVKTAKA
jgi:small subunit ribosomal protein S6